uniref:Hypocretin neuropeptide precursor n=1 Tax=Gouania willdenowi TaxID=441366 RepID=A0A8C5DBN3_GOUWI
LSPRQLNYSNVSTTKPLVLVLMLLLSQLACDAHDVSQCCRQTSRSCRLHMLLCRSSITTMDGARPGDASAGILTLGKRGEDELQYQSRLYHLLHGSRNQAAGILTMGKRTGARMDKDYMDWLAQSESTMVTPVPV